MGSQRQPVSMIIVSYNTSDLLQACLNSIKGQLGDEDEVIVVDNASSDGSYQIVEKQYPWAKGIANRENVGFARANNQALSIANGQIIWYLNPDARLYDGAMDAAKKYMEDNVQIGLAGTALTNPDGSYQQSLEMTYPSQRYTGDLFDGLPGEIAWVMGSSMVARREAIEQVGGFDERHFLYGEDLDLCLSIRKAGWAIGFIESCRVLHVGGQSERDTPPATLLEKKMMAELRFFGKHYPPAAIRKIKRKNRIQALWRLATLRLQILLQPQNQTAAAKFLKYRLTRQIYQ